MKFIRLGAVRGRGEKNDLQTGLLRDAANKMVALLLASRGPRRSGAGVNFVHDQQLRTLLDENIAASLRFDEVDADDLIGIIVVNAGVALDLAVETSLRVRSDDHGFKVEFVPNLILPLFTKVGQADHSETLDFPPLQ